MNDEIIGYGHIEYWNCSICKTRNPRFDYVFEDESMMTLDEVVCNYCGENYSKQSLIESYSAINHFIPVRKKKFKIAVKFRFLRGLLDEPFAHIDHLISNKYYGFAYRGDTVKTGKWGANFILEIPPSYLLRFLRDLNELGIVSDAKHITQ